MILLCLQKVKNEEATKVLVVKPSGVKKEQVVCSSGCKTGKGA